MRLLSGITDQVVYFVAVDSTDFTTRETGLSSFTVYRARNGGAAAAMTTPTVAEVDATNMPGVYSLLLDEDTTVTSLNASEAMVFHITQASMAPVTLEVELYEPANYAVDVGSVSANAIDATSIATGAITAAKFAASAITSTVMAADAITSTILADGAITAAKVTGTPAVNATAISGSTAAADAAEVCFTGTVTAFDGLQDISAAEVNAEVSDVIKTDTYAEMSQGAPPAAPTLSRMINYLYREYVRNQVKVDNSGNYKEVYADDGTTVLYKKSLTDASSILTLGESETGP